MNPEAVKALGELAERVGSIPWPVQTIVGICSVIAVWGIFYQWPKAMKEYWKYKREGK